MENSGIELTNDEKIGRLQKAFAAYNVQHDFKVGDIVIGKKDCPAPYKSMDQPHIVVGTGVTAMNYGENGENGEGGHRSLRVATLGGGRFNTYLVDPAYFEPYAG